MATPRTKKPALDIYASLRRRDEEKFTILEKLDHTPRPGEGFEIEGQRWHGGLDESD